LLNSEKFFLDIGLKEHTVFEELEWRMNHRGVFQQIPVTANEILSIY